MTLLSLASPLGLLCGECLRLTGLTRPDHPAAEGSTCDCGGGRTVSPPGLLSQDLDVIPLPQACPTLLQGLWLRPGSSAPPSPYPRAQERQPGSCPGSQKAGWLLATLPGPSAGLLLCRFLVSLIEGCLPRPFLSTEVFYSQGCVQSTQRFEKKSGIITSTL